MSQSPRAALNAFGLFAAGVSWSARPRTCHGRLRAFRDRSPLRSSAIDLPLLDICGTDADPCQATWAGQFVTEPLTTTVDGDWVVIASGFMFDNTHPAGLVATRVQIKSGRPTLEKLWQTPDPST